MAPYQPAEPAAAAAGASALEAKKPRRFTYADLREHCRSDDLWLTVHGKVYDATAFAARHPGGRIILNAAGIDGTVLYEAHHNMLSDSRRAGLQAVLDKMYIGELDGFTPIADFDSPFAKTLLRRVRDYVERRTSEAAWIGRRWDYLSQASVLFFLGLYGVLMYKIATTGALVYYVLQGFATSMGHVCGHAANHYSLYETSWSNEFISMLCTNLWGLREQYWTFSHLLSHHCYNYAERDYMIEQHVPTRYFRTRPEEPWKPVHRFQHLVYYVSPAMAFFMGAMRWDCAPWSIIAPVCVPLLTYLGFLRAGESSVAAPQFTASGSTHSAADLSPHEDGVGMNNKFVVLEPLSLKLRSLFIANIVTMPVFICVALQYGFVYAFLAQSVMFGVQSAQAIRTLLVQHLSEDIILKPILESEDDWYKMQIEASTSVSCNLAMRFVNYGITYQVEHHLFPCMTPQLLHEIAPLVKQTCAEHGVVYNHFESLGAARQSVYKRFKNLATKPAHLSE